MENLLCVLLSESWMMGIGDFGFYGIFGLGIWMVVGECWIVVGWEKLGVVWFVID